MEINIPTGQDILRDIAIQYVNKAFVYVTDCNPPSIKLQRLKIGTMHARNTKFANFLGFAAHCLDQELVHNANGLLQRTSINCP